MRTKLPNRDVAVWLQCLVRDLLASNVPNEPRAALPGFARDYRHCQAPTGVCDVSQPFRLNDPKILR